MRGSDYLASIINISFCSINYWYFTFGSMFSLILVTIGLSIYLRVGIKKKINVGYNFDDFDMIWNLWPCSLCSIAAVIAGVCSGLLSVGGGIFMSPFFLRLGLRPEVVVPTSSVLYVLTSSMAVILFIIAGKLLYSYAIVIGISSFIGSIIGILVIRKLILKFKRVSLTIFSMTLLVALCTIFVPTYGIIRYSNGVSDKTSLTFCPED